jgi:hypothetical protein
MCFLGSEVKSSIQNTNFIKKYQSSLNIYQCIHCTFYSEVGMVNMMSNVMTAMIRSEACQVIMVRIIYCNQLSQGSCPHRGKVKMRYNKHLFRGKHRKGIRVLKGERNRCFHIRCENTNRSSLKWNKQNTKQIKRYLLNENKKGRDAPRFKSHFVEDG